MVLSSCSDENESTIPTGNEAIFTPLISGLEPAAESRASGGNWQVNDRVGVFMLASGDDAFPALANNCEYFATASGGNTALLPASSGQTIYYPMDDSGVTFMAYYPYTSSLGDDETNPVYAVDLTDQSSLEDLDLLYHKGTAVYSNALPNATLNFKHQLVKMEINVSRGAGIETPLTDMVIKVKGVSATADFELATGELTNEGDATSIEVGALSVTADEGQYAAILLPQDAVEGREIAFSLGSLDYSYELPADLDLEAGKVYTLNFSFGEAEATFMGVTIKDWATAIPIDGYTVILFDKEYFFSKEAYQRNSLIIKTDYPELPLIRFSDSSNPDAGVTGNWLSQSVAASPDEDTYYKVGSENGIHTYELLFDVAANSSTERTAFIHITIGSRSMIVSVKQSDKDIMSYVYKQPESNCYIVHPGGVGIAIPVSRANTFAASAEGQSDGATVISGDFTAELLWSDVAGTNNTGLATDAAVRYVGTYGTGATGYVIVQPGTQEGNAVVTVKENGVVKWSWHIWVTAYNPWTSVNSTNASNGVVFMDRNLGATNEPGKGSIDPTRVSSYGLYYQWGRKDPFPKQTMFKVPASHQVVVYTATEDTRTMTVVLDRRADYPTSIQNPLVFYTFYENGNSEWLDEVNENLWKDVLGNKTIYDPCPIGWCVPKLTSQFDNYLMTPKDYPCSEEQLFNPESDLPYIMGAYSKDDSWYPSQGALSQGSGSFLNNGLHGFYWTAEFIYASGGYARGRSLYIKYGIELYALESSRSLSTGQNVRCIKE